MWISKQLVKAFQKETVAANSANEILSDITKLFIEYMKIPSGQIGRNQLDFWFILSLYILKTNHHI